MARFELVTHWYLDAPIEKVWERLRDADTWPLWWPSVIRVEPLKGGGADGIGTIRRLHWKTALPYAVRFDVEVVGIEPLARIEGRARGELEGVGVWTLRRESCGTVARYDWRVEVTKAWMRTLAPILRPVFAWNHAVVMRRGEAGLARLLRADGGR